MQLAVAIATAGRREAVSELLSHLARQSRLPDVVAICPASPDDVDQAACEAAPFLVNVYTGPRGLTSQRNLLINSLDDADIILFFDDDFVPAPAYLAECEKAFGRDDNIVMVTGYVIADGILGPGMTLEEAEQELDGDRGQPTDKLVPVYNGYGCNMAIRAEVARRTQLRFDEALPLYGWLEDVDFSRGLAAYGAIVKSDRCRGVHRGVKRGRTAGVKLGYSQIANPVYLARKRRLALSRAVAQMSRNIAQNLARSLRPEPWVDRKGRLVGNLKALKALALGQLHPADIRDLP